MRWQDACGCGCCCPRAGFGFGLAVVVGVLSVAQRSKLVLHCAHVVRDLAWSRGGTAVHRLLGGSSLYVYFAAGSRWPLPEVRRPARRQLLITRTSYYGGERLRDLPAVNLGGGVPTREYAHVVVQPRVTYQTWMGFGGSFTESSADLFASASLENQKLIMDAYFDEHLGLGYTLGRLHMNSCDFSGSSWSCDDSPDDIQLVNFSIQRYHRSILPMVRRAAECAGRNLTLIASPWSPPAWMKDTGRMVHGGSLLWKHHSTWARFFVRFALEMKLAGVPLWGFTVQNEPDAVTPWENCYFSPRDELEFIRDFLGPALEASKLDLRLLFWDHNRDNMLLRAQTIYADPRAAEYVWGIGYHWYGDPRHEIWPDRSGQVSWDNVQRVHELRPDKHIIMTEASQEFGPRIGDWATGERYAEALIRDMNHWLEAWIDWNLVLDETGGPNHVGNLVSAPVILDTARGQVLHLPSYYYLAHFSRYIRPGAKRIAVGTNRDTLEATAFINPDGVIVVVVLNRSIWPSEFLLLFPSMMSEVSVRLNAPAHSIQTLRLVDEPR
ncbi:unnamed protein product [Prorocentrum cordatum]|uniref:Glucosylceramidase n=1 Tax=Prorocentrum cordatum TaxID=2364126 RepID=A0ABN9UBD3_9DINO|nr:unnamed protein product [Polarella glacialis]